LHLDSVEYSMEMTRRLPMKTRTQAVAVTLGLTLALGAGGTGVTLAQDMGAGMMGDEGSMEMMGSGEGMGPGMGMMGPGKVMMQEMQAMRAMLSAEQPGELRELMREHRPAQFERMGHGMNVRDELMAELQQDRPDPDAIREIHGRMADVHGEMMAEQVRMRNAMYDLLSDQQREQLRDMARDVGDAPTDHEAHHSGP